MSSVQREQARVIELLIERVAYDGAGHSVRPVDPRRCRGRSSRLGQIRTRHTSPADPDHESVEPRARHPRGNSVPAGDGAGTRVNYRTGSATHCGNCGLANAAGDVGELFLALMSRTTLVRGLGIVERVADPPERGNWVHPRVIAVARERRHEKGRRSVWLTRLL